MISAQDVPAEILVETIKRDRTKKFKRTKQALEDAPAEILAETIVHNRGRTKKKIKHTTLAVVGRESDNESVFFDSLIVREVNNRRIDDTEHKLVLDGTFTAIANKRRIGDTEHKLDLVGAISAICVSPDGTTVVTGHKYGMIIVWTVPSWERSEPALDDMDEVGTDIKELACSCDGILGALFEEEHVILWDIKSEKCLYKWTINVNDPSCPAFSFAGPHFAYMSKDYRDEPHILLFNCDTKRKKLVKKSFLATLGVDDISTLAFCGARLAIGSGSGVVNLLGIRNLKSITLVGSLHGHSARVSAVAARTDGTRLAAGYADGTIRIWCLTTTSRLLHVFQTHDSRVDYLTFLRDDITLASSNIDSRAARLFDLWGTPYPSFGLTVIVLPRVLSSSKSILRNDKTRKAPFLRTFPSNKRYFSCPWLISHFTSHARRCKIQSL